MMLRDEAIQAIADAFLLHPDHPVLMSDIPHASVAALDGLLGWLRENGTVVAESPMPSTVTSRWRLATFTVSALIDLLSEGSER